MCECAILVSYNYNLLFTSRYIIIPVTEINCVCTLQPRRGSASLIFTITWAQCSWRFADSNMVRCENIGQVPTQLPRKNKHV